MAKIEKKRRVVRVDELELPKPVRAEDFAALCDTSNIPRAHQQSLKNRLDGLVEAFADWMRNERRQAGRSLDRERLKNALTQMKEAASKVSKLGPSGRQALRITSRSFAPMLSAQWLNDKFPDDDYAPQKVAVPDQIASRLLVRTKLRAEKYFIEEYSLEARDQFVWNRAVQVAGAILGVIEEGLRQSLREINHRPGARGGRKPLKYRHYLLVNLARIWADLGKEVSTGPKSDFAAFCESIAVMIGWPSDGIAAAIPNALKDWRNRP
jgi:hypothetical protein